MTETKDQAKDPQGPVAFISQMVNLDYKVVTSPVHLRFDQLMREGRIVGHKCPQCERVYVPPRGFCPLCCVVTTQVDEAEVQDTGVVTSFTVITPIQYRGQKERDEYVLANILLDGASGTIGQQRVGGMPNDQVRMGMRVKARWATPGTDDEEGGGQGARAGWGLGAMVEHWEPTGEPDASREHYQEHVL